MSDSESDLSGASAVSELELSDDEELLHLFPRRSLPKNENYLAETVTRLNEKEFIEHFRMSRNIAVEIGQRFSTSEYFKFKSGGNGKLSGYDQCLIYLWFVGHQTSSFKDVADRFNISISSLHRVINRFTFFLSNMAPQIIRWPDLGEKRDIEQGFIQKGFPGVIRVIDGSHIKIDKPENDPDSYVNRKSFYSIQIQVVCDDRKKIRDIFVGYPGSVHDTRVFRASPLSETLAEKCGDYYILGDRAYPCQRHLLIPFKDTGHLTQRQRNFNTRLSSSRYVIEHTFGIMKQKFRQLYHIKLRNINVIVHLIRACCVLHNLALDDEFPGEMEAVEDDGQYEVNVDIQDEEQDEPRGVDFRNNVMNNVLLL